MPGWALSMCSRYPGIAESRMRNACHGVAWLPLVTTRGVPGTSARTRRSSDSLTTRMTPILPSGQPGTSEGSAHVPRDRVAVGEAGAGTGGRHGVGTGSQTDLWPEVDVVGRGLRRTQRDPVDREHHAVHVAVHLDGGDRVGAVGPAPAGEVDERGRRPVGLVPVEGVLPGEPVVADQPLVVAPHGVALAAGVRGEVEHVPHEAAPEVWPGLDLAPTCLVEQRLVFLGMPDAVRCWLRRRTR